MERGLDRNIGDQLNKAYEAYRQASIEKENARKELKQKTEAYDRYICELHQQLENQKQEIASLKSQLNSVGSLSKGRVKGSDATPEIKDSHLPAQRTHETKPLSQCDHLHETNRQRQKHESMKTPEMTVYSSPGISDDKSKEILEAFQEIQGKFHVIQNLTRKQKDHLNKLCRANDTAQEQQFSMPIQCTDVTVEQAEGPFTSAKKSDSDKETTSASITSRGVCPEEGEFMESLSKLSIKFPPAESEYDVFLNSAPERKLDLAPGRNDHALATSLPRVTDEQTVDIPVQYAFANPTSQTPSPSTSFTHENVRGPQQPYWSPEHCEGGYTDPEQKRNPENCAFCDAILPEDTFFRHLNSHFENKTRNGF
ncbi:TRAF family member-associated NF-kappa-B activator isoform X2 [Lepisosteus oculatus]|uniref:TRAF family member-associated NF-kappa-B activator isoform X2 n=1 Tax=Lepisosteus oculatus TaxID=7918 RepID=UPI00073FE371|nr:PREDICTED: TRAF family member-associated NF-kappa-B activator isoform X2 [Lepisosteus oculatus]